MDGNAELMRQLTVARKLCAAAGRPPAAALSALAGGKNNRVFRVACEDGSLLAMKLYHVDARDSRDRLGAEWSFLSYVWDRDVRMVPQPLACDRETNSALYSFVPGDKTEASAISQMLVDQAADFILAANDVPRRPLDLAPGSESCFSLTDHLAVVERRVARLTNLDPEAPLRDAASRLVTENLLPAWRNVKAKLQSEQGKHDIVPVEEYCVSPSDFGFHNALVDDGGRAVFIDFEYAGHDDPAKLVCDFFCCPGIQVPIGFRREFVEKLANGLELRAGFSSRCDLLIDAYRIKWTCIILNDFLPLGAARREFAVQDEREARCADQLQKATNKLAEIGLR
jgi:hypothetical protein